jgi:hypothetical protein
MSSLYDYDKNIPDYSRVSAAVVAWEQKLKEVTKDASLKAKIDPKYEPIQLGLRGRRLFKYNLIENYLFTNISENQRDLEWVRKAIESAGFSEAELLNYNEQINYKNPITSVELAVVPPVDDAVPKEAPKEAPKDDSIYDSSRPEIWILKTDNSHKVTKDTFTTIDKNPSHVMNSILNRLSPLAKSALVINSIVEDMKAIDIPNADNLIGYGYDVFNDTFLLIKRLFNANDTTNPINVRIKSDAATLVLRLICYKMYLNRLVERKMNVKYYQKTIKATEIDKIVYFDDSWVKVAARNAGGGTFGMGSESINDKPFIPAIYSSNMDQLCLKYQSPFEMYNKLNKPSTRDELISKLNGAGYGILMYILDGMTLKEVTAAGNSLIRLFIDETLPANINYPSIFLQPAIYQKLLDNDILLEDYPHTVRSVRGKIVNYNMATMV